MAWDAATFICALEYLEVAVWPFNYKRKKETD